MNYAIAYLLTGHWQVLQKTPEGTFDRGLHTSLEEAIKTVAVLTGAPVLLKVLSRDDAP